MNYNLKSNTRLVYLKGEIWKWVHERSIYPYIDRYRERDSEKKKKKKKGGTNAPPRAHNMSPK